MVTKRQIDKLAENLTGRELAFLSIQYMEDVDHNREPVYTEEELDKMKKSIKDNVREHRYRYDRWLDVYNTLRYYVENAKIQNLKAKNNLNWLSKLFSNLLTDHVIKINKQKLPIPMTQKEYEDKKELQKEIELNKYHCIDEIISNRASRMVEEEEDDLSGDSHYPEFVKENYPKYYERAKKQINEIVDDNLLTPVKKGTLEEWIAENKTEKELKEYNKKFKFLAKKMELKKLDSLEKQFFNNISSWASKEDLQDSSEREVWLYQTYIKAEELYQAKLPEWTEWIDKYKHGWYDFQKDEAGWSWLGEIAIVQNSESENLDDKGWYKKDALFTDVIGREETEASLLEQCKRGGITISEIIETYYYNTTISIIKDYKSISKLLDTFSKIIGDVDLTEDLTKYEHNLKETINSYNNLIDSVKKWYVVNTEGESEEINLKDFKQDYEDISKDKEYTQELREIFVSVFGKKWWQKDPEEVEVDG